MQQNELMSAIECILFVAGNPVPRIQLQSILNITDIEFSHVIEQMQQRFDEEDRGIQIFVTEETIQLTSNPKFASYVQEFLQPAQNKTLSQAMLETLAIVAYRQPVTRADIEAIRGVRCEYSVSQLLRQGFIRELGRRNTVGRPMMFGTTDLFLRQFGIHSINELPNFVAETDTDDDAEQITV